MKTELVIFDMAGTTVADNGEVPAAFEAALAADGIVVTPAQIHAVRGSSKKQAVLTLTPDGPDREARAARIYADFAARLGQTYSQSAQPIAGAEAAFAALRARGVKLALNTGFDRDITALLIGALGWADKIDVIVCGDDVENGRPASDLIHAAMRAAGVSDPARVANVGDTINDLRAAVAAQVGVSIGVLSGAHDRAALAREPHSALIGSVADLPAKLTELAQI